MKGGNNMSDNRIIASLMKSIFEEHNEEAEFALFASIQSRDDFCRIMANALVEKGVTVG